MSVLKTLTENIVKRNLQRDGAALVQKWEKTGLLEGITDDQKREGMARLLENQAKQLLKEASTLGAGDVQGFASVAFPIVRRVFGGLIANDLVPLALIRRSFSETVYTIDNSWGNAWREKNEKTPVFNYAP